MSALATFFAARFLRAAFFTGASATGSGSAFALVTFLAAVFFLTATFFLAGAFFTVVVFLAATFFLAARFFLAGGEPKRVCSNSGGVLMGTKNRVVLSMLEFDRSHRPFY